MSDGRGVAHSLAEVYLYLMVTPCARCGKGPLQGGDARPECWGDTPGVTVDTRCAACGDQSRVCFEVPGEDLAASRNAPPDTVARVNSTGQRSQIIDVGGWMTLFGVIADAAARATDKAEARRLGYEAAQCLDEALKFYEPENELPPDSAFFDEASRRRYRDHPERLARSRLIGLRARLPSIDAMEKRLLSEKKRKRWWQWRS